MKRGDPKNEKSDKTFSLHKSNPLFLKQVKGVFSPKEERGEIAVPKQFEVSSYLLRDTGTWI